MRLRKKKPIYDIGPTLSASAEGEGHEWPWDSYVTLCGLTLIPAPMNYDDTVCPVCAGERARLVKR